MSAAVTLLAKQRGGPAFRQQVLFYPVTDANFDTESYRQFATGYHLRRAGMQWYWDQDGSNGVGAGQTTGDRWYRYHRCPSGSGGIRRKLPTCTCSW